MPKASMATKAKHRKKSKAGSKVTFRPATDDMEADNIGGEEDEVPAADGGEDRGKEEGEEEEFNLDEVLRLGGTQASYRIQPNKNDKKRIQAGFLCL